jgi:hypothetical protein
LRFAGAARFAGFAGKFTQFPQFLKGLSTTLKFGIIVIEV